MTDRKILIDPPGEAVVMAARHLDWTEGPVQTGTTVDMSTRSAINCVLRYIAKAHNASAVEPPAPGQTAPGERVKEALRQCGIYDAEERIWRSLSAAWIEEITPAVLEAMRPPAEKTELRDLAADAIRAASCPWNDCPMTEAECSRQRIQPVVWEHGVLAEVYGRPEWFADAVLAALPAPADQAPTLTESERLFLTFALDLAAETITSRGYRFSDSDASSIRTLRALAAGPQPEAQTDPPGETECANCWRLVENRSEPSMDGNHRDNWVHVPGGFSACFPQRGGDSPRAEPKI